MGPVINDEPLNWREGRVNSWTYLTLFNAVDAC